ncbi:UNVERIFIED_ORG: hypothetical protein J2X79_003222 [Arthrobacter globiformis]|nr:hypothetical protein [Arthrobacter globiformis]
MVYSIEWCSPIQTVAEYTTTQFIGITDPYA